MPRLISYFNRVEDGGGEGRRRTGNLSLASVAAGHSLVAPCGLENSKEAGGVSQGGGEGTPSQSSTGCNRAGRRKWLACGRVFDYWDVRGGCQWSSTCAHVNRTEGGVRPQAKTPSGVRHCDVTAFLMLPLIDTPSPPPHWKHPIKSNNALCQCTTGEGVFSFFTWAEVAESQLLLSYYYYIIITTLYYKVHFF